MEESIRKLKVAFSKIKNVSLHKSLRVGYTGIGFTFESLINKKEDQSYFPDFEGIEIKTKLGYSKSPISLFTLVPKKNGQSCISYILNSYGYPNKNNNKYKAFRGDAYCRNNNIIANKYIFKLVVNKNNGRLQLNILNRYFELLDNSIYWDLEDIQKRLFTKLQYLAYIKGYPYKKNGETFYKYTSLNIYKLKDFNKFLELIEKDIVHVTFNIGQHISEDRAGQICDRGTSFRINNKDIEELFIKIE